MSYNNFSIGQFFFQDAWNTVAAAWDEQPPTTKFITGCVILAASLSICQRAYSAWQRGCQQQEETTPAALNRESSLLIQAMRCTQYAQCESILQNANFEDVPPDEIIAAFDEALEAIDFDDQNDPLPNIENVIQILHNKGVDLNSMVRADGKRLLYSLRPNRRKLEKFEYLIQAGLDPTLPETISVDARNFLDFYFSECWEPWADRSEQVLSCVTQCDGYKNMTLSLDCLTKTLLSQDTNENGESIVRVDGRKLKGLLALRESYPWLFGVKDIPSQAITTEIFFDELIPEMEKQHDGDMGALYDVLRNMEGIDVRGLFAGCIVPLSSEKIKMLIEIYAERMGADEVQFLVNYLPLQDLIKFIGKNTDLKKYVTSENLLLRLRFSKTRDEITRSPHIMAEIFNDFDHLHLVELFKGLESIVPLDVREETMDMCICGGDTVDGAFVGQTQEILNFLAERREFSPEKLIKWVDVLSGLGAEVPPFSGDLATCPIGFIPTYLQRGLVVVTPENLIACVTGRDDVRAAYIAHVLTPEDLAQIQIGGMPLIDNCVAYGMDKVHATLNAKGLFFTPTEDRCQVVERILVAEMRKGITWLNERFPIEIRELHLLAGERDSMWNEHMHLQAKSRVEAAMVIDAAREHGVEIGCGFGGSMFSMQLDMRGKLRMLAGSHLEPLWEKLSVELIKTWSFEEQMGQVLSGFMAGHFKGEMIENIPTMLAMQTLPEADMTKLREKVEGICSIRGEERGLGGRIIKRFTQYLPSKASVLLTGLNASRRFKQFFSRGKLGNVPQTREGRIEALGECLAEGCWVRAADLVRGMSANELREFEQSAPIKAFLSGSPSLRKALDAKSIVLDFTDAGICQNLERALVQEIHDELIKRGEIVQNDFPELCRAKEVLKKILKEEALEPEEKCIAEVIKIEVRRRIEEAAICARARQAGHEAMCILDEWNSLWPVLMVANASDWEQYASVPNHVVQAAGLVADHAKDLASTDLGAETRHIQNGGEPRLDSQLSTVISVLQMLRLVHSLTDIIGFTALAKPVLSQFLENVLQEHAPTERGATAEGEADNAPRVIVRDSSAGEDGEDAARAEEEVAAAHQSSLV